MTTGEGVVEVAEIKNGVGAHHFGQARDLLALAEEDAAGDYSAEARLRRAELHAQLAWVAAWAAMGATEMPDQERVAWQEIVGDVDADSDDE